MHVYVCIYYNKNKSKIYKFIYIHIFIVIYIFFYGSLFLCVNGLKINT